MWSGHSFCHKPLLNLSRQIRHTENTLQHETVSLINLILLCPLNINQILQFLQSMVITSDLTGEMSSSDLKHGKSGITCDSSHKISRYVRFSCFVGGHIGLFVIRPPGDRLNLFAMFFLKLDTYTYHHTKFQNLSPSARFYLYMAYSSPASNRFPASLHKYTHTHTNVCVYHIRNVLAEGKFIITKCATKCIGRRFKRSFPVAIRIKLSDVHLNAFELPKHSLPLNYICSYQSAIQYLPQPLHLVLRTQFILI